MYTLLNPIIIREELLKRGIKIFTPQNFSGIFQTSPDSTKYFLEKWVKDKFLIRLKKGLYALKSDLPSEEEIANRLYKPSYLSFEYALAFYNILPEMTYEVTSVTTQPTRVFTLDTKTFSYLRIKKAFYTGYSLIQKGEKAFFIAEPEKALVDYLYFVALGKKPFNERLNISNLNKEKILEYAKLFERPKLDKMIRDLI